MMETMETFATRARRAFRCALPRKLNLSFDTFPENARNSGPDRWMDQTRDRLKARQTFDVGAREGRGGGRGEDEKSLSRASLPLPFASSFLPRSIPLAANSSNSAMLSHKSSCAFLSYVQSEPRMRSGGNLFTRSRNDEHIFPLPHSYLHAKTFSMPFCLAFSSHKRKRASVPPSVSVKLLEFVSFPS